MTAFLVAHSNDEALLLTFIFQQAGLSVHRSQKLEVEAEEWYEQSPDFIILAMQEVKQDGLAIVKKIRSASLAPLVMITDPILEDTQILLYQAGVDFVVVRPYSARLLTIQIRALLRRATRMNPFVLPDLTAGDIVLNPATRQVSISHSAPIHLTNLEFRMLHALLIHAGHILSIEFLVNTVWGYAEEGNRELVRGLIQRLRTKIEPDPHEPRYILTEPGVGYQLNLSG